MKIRLAIALVVAAAFARLIPHPDNFTPIGAMGLFAAAYFRQDRWMLLIPFAALFVSDLLLNNVVYSHLFQGFTWITSWMIYAAFALIMLVGWQVLRGKIAPGKVALASLMASVVFFVVTNFWSWYAFDFYPKNAAGLSASFVAGLPFFGNTLMGDLFFSAVMFGTYEWVSRKHFAFEKA